MKISRLTSIVFAFFAFCLSMTAQTPGRSATQETNELLRQLIAETSDATTAYTKPRTAYCSINDSTAVVVYDVVTTKPNGVRAVEPVECLYSITSSATLAAFNFVNSNGMSILQVAQKLYESKIGDKDTSQSEDLFRDEIYWFTILSHLSEKGHRIK